MQSQITVDPNDFDVEVLDAKWRKLHKLAWLASLQTGPIAIIGIVAVAWRFAGTVHPETGMGLSLAAIVLVVIAERFIESVYEHKAKEGAIASGHVGPDPSPA